MHYVTARSDKFYFKIWQNSLARFPNNAYEAMKLTKGDVSQCPLFNFKKTEAIIEKYQ
jgi:hypothetical protein